MSEQTRVPAGVRTGGQFTTGARGESAADLTGPVAASAHRADADTWQHPAGVDRALAITSYDDQAGWAVIGEHLRVRTPRTTDSGWVDAARPLLGQLHAAGLHGDAVAQSPATSGFLRSAHDRFSLAVTLPSGRTLDIDSTTDERRFVGVSWPDNWTSRSVFAPGRYGDVDQGELDALIDDVVAGHDAAAAFDRAAAAEGLRSTVRRVTFAEAYDGEQMRLRIFAPSVVGPTTTFAIRDGQARIVAVTGDGTVEHDDRQLADLARRIGLRGGKRARAGERAQALLDAAAHGAQHGPDLAAVRAHRARLRG
ncbi:hypothetical protein [Cellulosimicrobium sp. Marseille-Q4280]|uniref:hypothetical protein n=1 Tax=Cellulosimicrobium sp. Marseille-Q4280 TaxID=2937992 RepID=UPI00203B3D2A|nr:hypothetical protein [Cellulosimicrobium sp. Marseille-Q4280]